MIPFSDGLSARRFPTVNVAIIAANFAVWLFYELPHLDSSIAHASFYPCTVDGSCHGPEPWGISWLTAMFLHGSWGRILGNMIFLAVFGKNVEDAFGHVRYLAFYLAGGFVATAAQTAMTLLAGNKADTLVPNLGASGAIAAVLGAYFVLLSALEGVLARRDHPAAAVSVVLPRLLVPLPAVRGELRHARRAGERRWRRVLRTRRRLRLRLRRGEGSRRRWPRRGRDSGARRELTSWRRSPGARPTNHAGTTTPLAVTLAPRTIVLFVAVAIGGLALAGLTWAARSILTELVVAIVLAMAAEPLVQLFERRGHSRSRAVGISFGLAVLVVVGFAYLLVTPFVHESRHLVDDAPRLVDELSHGHGRLGFLEERFHVVERTRDAVESRPASATAGPILDRLGSAVHTGGALVFVAFLTLFVQLGGRQWFGSLVELAPDGARGRIRRAGEGVAAAVGGYVAGNLFISVVAGTVTTVALLATGVPYALPLGLVVAILDLIPLVGATLGTVIAGAVALTHSVPAAVIVVVTMIVYQQIENHSLQQLVYHRTVKLSALTIALSVALGAELGGVVGALLGIPFAGALKAVATELIAWRRGEDAPA